MSLAPNVWDDHLMVIDGHSIDSRIRIWAIKGGIWVFPRMKMGS